MKSEIIVLEPSEISKAYNWAVYLKGQLDQKKMKNDVKGKGDKVSQLLAGKLGEVAVCKYLGVQTDFSEGSDGGKDLTWMGETIDVKCTPRANGKYLVWPKTKPLKIAADILVGCRQLSADYDSAEIEVCGYVKRLDFDTYFKYAFGNEGLVKGTAHGLLTKLRPISGLKTEQIGPDEMPLIEEV